jgi:hypothetical protein
MADDCELDLVRYPVKHYTHVRVDVEDYPWVAAEAAAQSAIANGEVQPTADEAEDEDEAFLESSDSEMGGNGDSDDAEGETEDDEDAMVT